MSGFDSSLGRPVTGDYFLRHSCLIGWVFSVVETEGRVHGCLPEFSAGPLGNIHRHDDSHPHRLLPGGYLPKPRYGTLPSFVPNANLAIRPQVIEEIAWG